MGNLYKKFDVPSFNGSLVIVARMQAKRNFCTAIVLFYVLQKIALTKLRSFQYITLRIYIIISVAPTSQICVSTMLLLLIVVKQNMKLGLFPVAQQ